MAVRIKQIHPSFHKCGKEIVSGSPICGVNRWLGPNAARSKWRVQQNHVVSCATRVDKGEATRRILSEQLSLVCCPVHGKVNELRHCRENECFGFVPKLSALTGYLAVVALS